MHVVIRYTENYEPARGGIECIDVPFESGLSRRRMAFCELSHHPGAYGLVIEYRKEFEKADNSFEMHHVVEWVQVPILVRERSDREEYLAWFAKNVNLVEVDGHQFWPVHRPFS